MPMLAETKRKSKVGLNPRGTLWTKDENKFGQKLLEKMGWAKGKGLGKNEQGCQDAIKVSANSENKGVGFKENSEAWTQHYQGFEDALANLNSLNNDEAATGQNLCDGENVLENVESLEIKSKSSKSRVHYKKFTRGKDLSRYNEDDLACVLGSKRAPKKGESETPIEDLDKGQACAEEELEIGQTDKSHGLTTVYGGNLKDYFTQKMAELKRKREEGLLGDGIETRSGDQTPSQSERSINSVPNTPFPDLEFTPRRTEFSFNYSLQEPEPEKEPECNNESSEVKVKKKKKSKEKDLEMEEVVNENETVKKKHKKDKKRKNEESDKENERRLVAEGSNESQKKEKKYCKRENELNENYSKNNEIDENNRDTTGGVEEESKKNKNKNIEIEYNTTTSDFVSKKKKKKKKKDENITCDCNGNCEHQNEFENNDDVALFSGDMNESYVQANCKEKNKKKKRKEKEEKDDEPLKPLKKLRRLASEISFSDILKSTNEKADKRVSLIDKDSVNDDELVEESEPKPKVKLTSKKSFRELTSELEDKIRKKVKKRNKNDMERIEEKEEEVSNDLEEKVKKRERKDYEKDMNSVEEKREVNEIEEKSRKKERKRLMKLTEEAKEGETNDEPKKKMKKRSTKDMEPTSEDEKKRITDDDSRMKIKKKDKKKSKKDMKFIEEGTGECLADHLVCVETNNEGEMESSDITVLVPEKENEDSFHSKIKHYKSLKVDVKKLFPGSNLLSIIGYTKND